MTFVQKDLHRYRRIESQLNDERSQFDVIQILALFFKVIHTIRFELIRLRCFVFQNLETIFS